MDDNEFAPKPRGPKRKPRAEKLRHTIHVCLNDAQLIDLMEISSPDDISVFVRGLIDKAIAERKVPNGG